MSGSRFLPALLLPLLGCCGFSAVAGSNDDTSSIPRTCTPARPARATLPTDARVRLALVVVGDLDRELGLKASALEVEEGKQLSVRFGEGALKVVAPLSSWKALDGLEREWACVLEAMKALKPHLATELQSFDYGRSESLRFVEGHLWMPRVKVPEPET